MAEENDYSEITDEIKLLIKELQLNFKIIKNKDEEFLETKKIFHKKTKLFFQRNDLAIDFFAEIIDEKLLYKIFPHVDIFNIIIENFIEKKQEGKIQFFLKQFNFHKSKMKYKLIASLIFRDKSLSEFNFTKSPDEKKLIILTSFFKNTVRFLRYIFKYLHNKTVLYALYDLFMQLNIFKYIFSKKYSEIILLVEEIMRVDYAHNKNNFTENILNCINYFYNIKVNQFEEEENSNQIIEIHRKCEKKAIISEKKIGPYRNIKKIDRKKNFTELLTVFFKMNFKYLIFQKNEEGVLFFPSFLLTHYLIFKQQELEIFFQEKFYGEEDSSLPFTEENKYAPIGEAILKYDQITFNETFENIYDNFNFLYFLIHTVKTDLPLPHVELIDMKKYKREKIILLTQIYFYRKVNISHFLSDDFICDLYRLVESEGGCLCTYFKEFKINICISCTIFTLLADIFEFNFSPIHFRISHVFIIYSYANNADKHVFIHRYMKKFLLNLSSDSFLYGKIFLYST